MIAKDYLKQIKKLDTMIRNKNAELDIAKELRLSAGEILGSIEKLKAERRGIIRTIETLPEAEYDVLHMVYVQNRTLYEVAGERSISYSLATTIHGKALKHLESIINATD